MVSLPVVFQEVRHAAAVMLIREIIARAPTMGRNGRNVVYGIASLLVARREVPHAVTVLISEIIALVPLMTGVIEPTVVYGTVNLLVASLEVLHATTVLISGVIARDLTRGMIKRTVVYGTVTLLAAFQEVLHVATMLISEIIAQAPKMGRTLASAQRVMARYFAGKARAEFSSISQLNKISEIQRKVQASVVTVHSFHAFAIHTPTSTVK